MTEMEKNLKELDEWFKLNPTEGAAYAFQKKLLEDEIARESESAVSAEDAQALTEKAAAEKPAADPMYSKWRLIRTFEGHEKNVNSVAFSPDGRHIVSGGSGESFEVSLKLWGL